MTPAAIMSEKDPASILDYRIDWSAWLGADTIQTSTWTTPTGISAGDGSNGAPAPSNTTTAATIWLFGGSDGVEYSVTNKIVTAGGRTEERSLIIPVRHR